MPWSVRLVLLLLLASAGAFAWSKRPFVSDAHKVCNVAVLSACPLPEASILGNECKIAWLERSMWRFGRLSKLPWGGGPGGGEFLRGLAREAGVAACPEAEVLDREFEGRRQQAEDAKRALAEHQSASGGDTDEARPDKRVSGVVKTETPAVDGELDPAVVSKEVRARIGVIKACYERALKRNPELSGKVKVHWTITTAGTVSDVEIGENSLGDSEASTCIQGLVKRWRFPAPSGGSVDVVVPFIFQTTKEASP